MKLADVDQVQQLLAARSAAARRLQEAEAGKLEIRIGYERIDNSALLECLKDDFRASVRAELAVIDAELRSLGLPLTD